MQKDMTEQAIRVRIKEIEEERAKLRKEKEKYEQYLSEQKIQEKKKMREFYTGKCFVSKNATNNKLRCIKAFKILRILDTPNEDFAECVTLTDGIRGGSWNEYGVQIMVLGLWRPSIMKLMSNPSDPDVIDGYMEISQEEFNVLYRLHCQKLNDAVF